MAQPDDDSPFVFGTGSRSPRAASLFAAAALIAVVGIGTAVAVGNSAVGDPKPDTTSTASLGGSLPPVVRNRGGGGGFVPRHNPVGQPGGETPAQQLATVPDGLVGTLGSEAVAHLHQADLQADVHYVCTPNPTADASHVIKLDHDPGDQLPAGSFVAVEVGAPSTLTATIPNLVNLSYEQAEQAGADAVLLVVPATTAVPAPTALVIGQEVSDGVQVFPAVPDTVVPACTKIFLQTAP
jgi:hypothetical protein